MEFEVEQKFRVDGFGPVEKQLSDWGATWSEAVEQVDTYYAHPSRDFAATDEALRVRRVGDVARMTYKGPKVDATTKTRREIEFEVADGAAAGALLEAVGFTRVTEVRKSRRTATVTRSGYTVEVALDNVENVGTFVELEVTACEDELNAARSALAEAAGEMELRANERRSYLEMLLAKSSGG